MSSKFSDLIFLYYVYIGQDVYSSLTLIENRLSNGLIKNYF
jgi:hypothetical protein